MWLTALLFCTASLAFTLAATPTEVMNEEWEVFKLKFSKSYKNDLDEQFRKMIFIENQFKIARHNKKFHRGNVHYSMKMNAFGDLMHHEFAATRNGLKRDYKEHGRNGSTFLRLENVQLPDEINWVDKGYVTDVKNQGECGSCWSFGATGALEGQHMRKTSKLVSLSEQNLVDCSSKYGNQGCEGGMPAFAFEYINDNKGVDTEESYPYEGKEDKCRFKKENVGATDTGYVDVESEDEDALKEAIATIGPISVGIDASQESLQFYSEGVYDEPDCSSENLNHAVLAVGYGNYEGDDFWLVKNSWGAEWGVEGYIRMSRNKDNQCGIATMATYPLV